MNTTPQTQTTPTKKNPFTVKEGQRALLLVPFENNFKEMVAELLSQQDLFADDDESRREKGLPRTVTQLKLVKLQDTDVIFTAVPVSTKLAARKQPTGWELKISKGVSASKFLGSDDDDVAPDYSAVIDAVQKGVHPFSCKVSQDKILKLLAV